jgi:hypothetical protein
MAEALTVSPRPRWRRALLVRLAALSRHPFVSLMVGIGLLLTGVAELLSDLFTDFETALRTYHGLILFGLVTAARGVTEFAEGMMSLGRDAEAMLEASTAQRGELVTPRPPRFP